MTISISAVSRCAGTNHVTVSYSINGGSTQTSTVLSSEFVLDPDDVRGAVVDRLRSAAKEAGASTWVQIQAAIVGKTFQV